MNATKALLTVPEAAEILNIGVTTAKGLIRRGELESVAIGGSRRVPAAAIEEFVERLRSDARDERQRGKQPRLLEDSEAPAKDREAKVRRLRVRPLINLQ